MRGVEPLQVVGLALSSVLPLVVSLVVLVVAILVRSSVWLAVPWLVQPSDRLLTMRSNSDLRIIVVSVSSSVMNSSVMTMAYATEPCLEIRNPRIVDASRDGVLTRGEEARMVFEIYNTSTKPVTRVLPAVAEVTGNKHIRVSENVMVESVLPGKGIRYTAVIRADNGLRDGEAIFRISVYQGNREVTSQVREFRIMTSKR